MLQPRQTSDDQQLVVSRILWGALTFSTLLYGVILFITGKIQTIALPTGELNPFELLAMGMNFLAMGVLFFYKNKVLSYSNFQQRFTGYIICWALNESIVVVGFMAVFVSERGNGLFYLTNLLVGITGNLLTFPKK